jgi:hypothetical protein
VKEEALAQFKIINKQVRHHRQTDACQLKCGERAPIIVIEGPIIGQQIGSKTPILHAK